jgi:hypothetical protein
VGNDTNKTRPFFTDVKVLRDRARNRGVFRAVREHYRQVIEEIQAVEEEHADDRAELLNRFSATDAAH